jgi:ribosome maturation factor RimP
MDFRKSVVGEEFTPFFISRTMHSHEQVLAEIRKMIEALNANVFIVDMALKQAGGTVLSILVDTDKGITIDECARISRNLNSFLETEAGLEFAYTLEVSSPGVGRPFKVKRQYFKNVGRKLKVKLADNSVRKGKLIEATEDHIVLDSTPAGKSKKAPVNPENTIQIPFDQIQEAVVEISFD